ncbi:hypothetical protein V9T40_013681 [Parthenolecanium corni]|uniref:Peptidase S1 domain-containing protein n=1 Tax=Parthenolecanium corni TaxID=536013 RepID=A0AAN9Y2U6_9HEMI
MHLSMYLNSVFFVFVTLYSHTRIISDAKTTIVPETPSKSNSEKITLRNGADQIFTISIDAEGKKSRTCQCVTFHLCNVEDVYYPTASESHIKCGEQEACCIRPQNFGNSQSTPTNSNDNSTEVCVAASQCDQNAQANNYGSRLIEDRRIFPDCPIDMVKCPANNVLPKLSTTPSPTSAPSVPQDCRCTPPGYCKGSFRAGIIQSRLFQCDVTEVCCPTNLIKPVFNLPTQPPSTTIVCGIKREDLSGRISGGTETVLGEFPWMVVILERENNKEKVKCGASLVSTNLVLTAAHCVQGRNLSSFIIRAGEYNLDLASEQLPHQDRDIKNISMHHAFFREHLLNDLAIIEVTEPFQYSSNVAPICLPLKKSPYSPEDTSVYDLSRCVATGWGSKDSDDPIGRNTLGKIEMKIIPSDQCVTMLRRSPLGPQFTLHPSFICAMGKPGTDTCKGDGGGPLVCPLRSNPNKYVQVGVIAGGLKCTSPFPSLYASLLHNSSAWRADEIYFKNIFSQADPKEKEYRDGRKKKPTHYSDYDSEEDRKVSYTDRRDNIGATCQYYYDPPLYGLSPKEKGELFTVDIEKSRKIIEKYKKKQVDIPEIVEIEDIDTLQIDDLKKELKETIDVQKEYQNILNDYLTDDQSNRENDLKKMEEVVRKLSRYEQEVKNETPTHPKYYSESMNKYREGLPRGNKPVIRDSLESFSGNPKIATSTSLHKQDEVEDTGTDGIKEDKQTNGARQETSERRNSRGKRYSPPEKWKEAEERRNERRSERREEYRRGSRDRDDDRNRYRDNRDRYRDERDRDREPDRRPYGREGHCDHRDSDPDDEDKNPSDRGRRNPRDNGNNRSGRHYDNDRNRSRRDKDDSRRSRRDRYSSDDDYEPDKDELWSDYINEEESDSSESEREYSKRGKKLNRSRRSGSGSRYNIQLPCLDPTKMDPYKENDTRSLPMFVEEFEGLTDQIKDDEKLRGVLFRQLFKETLYSRCTTMPRKVPYPIMRSWFLQVAWSKSAKRARCNRILSWTRESVGVENIAAFLQIINTKLIECEVNAADRFVFVTQKAPISYVVSLQEKDFKSPKALNVALSRIEWKKADHKIVNEFSYAHRENEKSEKEKPKCSFTRSKAVAVTGVGNETDAYTTDNAIQSDDEDSSGNENKTSTLIDKAQIKEKKDRSKNKIVTENPVEKSTAVNVSENGELEKTVEQPKLLETESSKNCYFVKSGATKTFARNDNIGKFDSRKETFNVSKTEDVKLISKPVEIMPHVLSLEENPATPRWLNYRVFGDPSFLSWLVKSKNSNLYGKVDPKVKSFPKIFRPYSLLNAAKDCSRKDDEIIIGMTEYMIDDRDFDLDDFTEKLKQILQYLFDEIKIKTAIVATIPIRPEKQRDGSYRGRIKLVNSKLWELKNNLNRMFIFDVQKKMTPTPSLGEDGKIDGRNGYYEIPTEGGKDHMRYIFEGAMKMDLELADTIRKFIPSSTEPPMCAVYMIGSRGKMDGLTFTGSEFTLLPLTNTNEVQQQEEEAVPEKKKEESLSPENESEIESEDFTPYEDEDVLTAPSDFNDEGSQNVSEIGSNFIVSCLGEDELHSSSEDKNCSAIDRERKEHMYMPVYIGEKTYSIMLDSGSRDSFITKEQLEIVEANHPGINVYKVKHIDNSIKVAAGATTLKTIYMCRIDMFIIDINGVKHQISIPLKVVKELHISIIVGQEHLGTLYGLVVDHKYRIADWRLKPENDERTSFKLYTYHEMRGMDAILLTIPED